MKRPANADDDQEEEDEEMRLYASRLNRSHQESNSGGGGGSHTRDVDSRVYQSGGGHRATSSNYRSNTVSELVFEKRVK